MKPSLEGLTPEQKRAMLAQMLKQHAAASKPAFILQGLFLDWMIYPTLVWNMRSTIRFFKKVDPELLRSRMQRIIDRHLPLRTTYNVKPDLMTDYQSTMLLITLQAVERYELNREALVEQTVHDSHAVDFTVVDASDWTPEQLRDRLVADACEGYDMRRLPVCRLRLYQRKNEDIMQLDVHHCAADLWSLEIIVAELEQPPEGPPPPSFAEFCAWQHAWFALPKAQAMREWWLKELEDCPALAFPDAEGDDPVDFVLFRLDALELAQARQACRAHKITLFNLILSTLQVTLRDALGMEDFAIGGAVANRPHQRFDDTVGFFAQLVLYRQDVSQASTWEELWARNRTKINDVVDRQFYPVTTTIPTPRTDVWIMFQQYKKARWFEGEPPVGEPLGLRIGGVIDSPLGPWEFIYVEPPFTSAPILLEIIEQSDGIQGALRYRTPCFTRTVAELYVQEFMANIRAALENPQASI